MPNLSAAEALQELKDGNSRFLASEGPGDSINRDDAFQVIKQQRPFAIILGCSDSRVPVELIFDQGLGQLFVIRVAGNIVAPSQIGSIEFAAANFGTRLVVVLGHSHCGAVEATIQELQQPAENRSPNLAAIVQRIQPAVQHLVRPGADSAAMSAEAVRANVRASVERLRNGSDILYELIASDELKVVGAEYSIETGAVEFFTD